MAQDGENNAQTSALGEDLTPEKNGGVLKVVKRAGHGDLRPTTGDTVFVHYVGTLADGGEKFDSSRDRDEEFSFTLGRGQVIKAWDLGVASMAKGELATLTCRADYAYGDAGSPPKIPAGATLVFEVELIRWTGEDISPDKDGSITKSSVIAGEKYAAPSDGARLTVHAIGSHNGRVFVDKEVEFALGECSEADLPDGVDKALKRFNKGEKAMVHLKTSKWTYGRQPPAPYGLPADAELDFELTLKDFEKVKASWEMDHEEKLTAAAEAKERGTKFFTEGKMRLAIDKYKRVVELLEHEKSLDDEQKTRRDALMIAAHLNLALVWLKQGETVECIEQCDKVIEIAPDNVKALYRRAQARQEQNDHDIAIADYKRVLELEPSNKAAQQGVNVCQHKLTEFKRTEKQKFARMFERFAAKDQKADLGKDKDEEARQKAFPDTDKPADIEMAHENGADHMETPSTSENGGDHIAVPSTSEA